MKATGSTTRHARAPFAGQRGRCAWCGTDKLPRGRRSWCSKACVDQYKIRSDPGHIRRLVHNRDRGVCAICGCDSDQEYRRWQRNRLQVRRIGELLMLAESRRSGLYPGPVEVSQFIQHLLDRYCPGRWTQGRQHGWDADHIVPVVEGGGECDLSNYRTLCHPCHKQVTKGLAARRAQRRRTEKEIK